MTAESKPARANSSGTLLLLQIGGAFAVLTGLLVLLGWALEVSALTTMSPNLVPMRVNSAIAFILTGVSMYLLGIPPTPRRRVSQGIAAAIVASLGACTLLEYLFDCDLGIDSMLLGGAEVAGGFSHPDRMAPAGTLCFVLAGIALIAMRPSFWSFQRQIGLRILGLSICIIGIFGILGFVADPKEGFRWWKATGMALNTSALFILLGLCITLRACKLKWTIGKGLSSAFAGGLLLLIVITLSTYRCIHSYTAAAELVRHTHVILLEIHEVWVSVDEALAAERSFVITGQADSLKPYTAAVEDLKQHRANLSALITNDPVQQIRVARLDSLVTAMLVRCSTIIDARQNGGFKAAAQLVTGGGGELFGAQIRQILSRIETEEDRNLTFRESAALALSRQTLLILPLGTIFSIVLIFSALLRLNREVTDRLQTERTVRERERRYRSLVVATSQMVWTTSPTGEVVDPRPSWQEFTGQSDAEIMGDGWVQAVHPDERERILKAWKTAVARKLVFETQFRLRRQDGVYRDFASRGVAVFAEDDTIREWVGTCTDITERKQAEETRELLASVVKSSDDAILTTDMDGKITSWNQAAEKLFGYSEADALEKPVTLLIPGDLQNEEHSIVEQLKRGVSTDHYETRRLRMDGTPFEVSLSVSPIKDSEGRIVGASKIVRDITERRIAERKIQLLNEELEQRVIERTAQLEAAIKELDSFSYSVSHDLRAPLRAIDGYSRMLEDDYESRLDSEGIRMLRVVRSETRRMGQLIDDLLAFCRLSRQQVLPQDIDMTALASAVFSELQLLDPARKLEFKLGQLCHTSGEPAMIRQVWVNLLSNAIKFTKHREPGLIEAGCLNQAGESIYYVKDNGAGFDMAYANKLFGVFQRLHSEGEFEGTGVGLALVQRIVTRHGGRIWAEGKVDEGATFYFTLPNLRK